MAVRSAVIEVLLFLTLSHHCETQSAVTQTLEYKCTVDTQGHFTVVGLLDGEEFMYCDSNTARMIPKTEWIKKVESDSSYWQKETRDVEVQQDWLMDKLQHLNSLNQGGDTLQRLYGCEIDDENITRGYDKSIYNGKDFISLDLNTGTWTAVDERAKRFTENWNPAQRPAAYWKNFVEGTCVDRLKSYMPYSTKKEEPGGAEGRSEEGADKGADEGKTGNRAVMVLVPVLVLAAAAAVSFVFYRRKLRDHLRSGFVAAHQGGEL